MVIYRLLPELGSIAHQNHLKIIFANATLWAHPVFGDVFPAGTRLYAIIRPAFGFIIDVTTDNALPLTIIVHQIVNTLNQYRWPPFYCKVTEKWTYLGELKTRK